MTLWTRLREHGLLRVGVPQRRVHVEHGVVEVRVRVAARARAQQALPLAAAQEGHVLHQVRYALLRWALVHRACQPAAGTGLRA